MCNKALKKDSAGYIGSVRRAASAGLIITAGLMIMRICAFVLAIIIARFSGAETLGEFTIFITVFILASEIPHAFDTAYLRAAGKKNGETEKHIYENINIAVKLLLIIIFGLLFFCFENSFASLLGKPKIGEIIAWAIICGGLNSVYMLLAARSQQRRDYFKVALLKPIFNFSVLLLAIAVLFVNGFLDIDAIFIIYLITGCVLAVISMVSTWDKRAYDNKNIHKFYSYLNVSLVLLMSTSLTLIGNRLDVFLLGYYLDFEDLGVYGVALRVSIVISVFTAAMSTIMIPRAAAACEDVSKFRRYIGLGLFYGAIQICIAIPVIIYIEPLIVLLFGSDYIIASVPASILIVQVLVSSLVIPFQALIQCGENPKIMIYISLLRITISIPLMLIMIPRYEINGAAAALALTTIFLAVAVVWLAIKDRPLGCYLIVWFNRADHMIE